MKIENLSRLFGVIWICIGLLWIGLCVLGIVYGVEWLAVAEVGLTGNMDLIVDSLDSVHGVIIETTTVVSSTHQTLITVQTSTLNASNSLDDMRPLVGKTTKIIATDVPNALDGVQDSMPSMIETAKSMDETLTWLANFEITIPNPIGSDWRYDFGIRYDPEVSLDQALDDMSQNLIGVPEDLRGLEESLSALDANLVIVGEDLANLAGDLNTTNQEVERVVTDLQKMSDNMEEIREVFVETQARIPDTFEAAKKIVIGILGLLIITQIPSLFMGGLLVSGELFKNRTD
jgi:hypothetical protein